VTREDLVSVVELGGETWLHYKAFPVNVALIRGTTADPAGNITMEREALTLDNLAAAMAAKNSGGFVIAQVERLAEAGSLNPREVQVPGVLVDCVVLSSPENHRQTYGTPYNHAFTGRQRVPLDRIAPMALDTRKGHRPALRLRAAARRRGQSRHRHARGRRGGRRRGAGAEIPDADRRARRDRRPAAGRAGFRRRPEPGPPCCTRTSSSTSTTAAASISPAWASPSATPRATSTSAASARGSRARAGSSTSRRTPRASSSPAPSRPTASRWRSRTAGIRILSEGRSRKFIAAVEQVTFSGAYAAERGQPVLYVTERCVFRRTRAGMELVEVAPGIDIARDILGQMGFTPIVQDPRPMDPRLFRESVMALEPWLLGLSLSERDQLRPGAQHPVLEPRGFPGPDHRRRRAGAPRIRARLPGDRPEGPPDRQLRRVRDRPDGERRVLLGDRLSRKPLLRDRVPGIPPARSCD
jgi:propionate CoA-transferase